MSSSELPRSAPLSTIEAASASGLEPAAAICPAVRRPPAGQCVGRRRRRRCSDRVERDGWFDESTVHFINIKSFIGCGACGYVGEGEHFPAFRACSGSGESGAGRQRRSSTYPQAFFVNLPRRAIAEALVLALLIVKAEPGADAGLGLGDRRIGVEVGE